MTTPKSQVNSLKTCTESLSTKMVNLKRLHYEPIRKKTSDLFTWL